MLHSDSFVALITQGGKEGGGGTITHYADFYGKIK